RLVDLRVGADPVVLGADVDVHVGVGAVVLDAPADVGEPEGVLRLGGEAPVHQGVAGGGADDAAPRPLAHDRPEAGQLEAVGEDVFVGPGVLVGYGHQRPGRVVGLVAVVLAPAADVVADAAPGQLLQHQLAVVAAAVEADVDDQRLALHLGQVGAVELGVAPGAHVGEVDVADPALGRL